MGAIVQGRARLSMRPVTAANHLWFATSARHMQDGERLAARVTKGVALEPMAAWQDAPPTLVCGGYETIVTTGEVAIKRKHFSAVS